MGSQLPKMMDATVGESGAMLEVNRGNVALGIANMMSWLSGLGKPSVASGDREMRRLQFDINARTGAETKNIKLE